MSWENVLKQSGNIFVLYSKEEEEMADNFYSAFHDRVVGIFKSEQAIIEWLSTQLTGNRYSLGKGKQLPSLLNEVDMFVKSYYLDEPRTNAYKTMIQDKLKDYNPKSPRYDPVAQKEREDYPEDYRLGLNEGF
mgnify:FL=1|jgi:hypothetical protein